MDTTQQSPVVLSLCTGSRGLERGVETIIGNITIAAYVEIEAFVILNLVKQMEQGVVDAAPVWSNLKTFPAKQFYGKIHGIIGGYPCQPFSVAGKRGGSDDPRHLWPFIKDQIQIIKPEWCFFENVANHLNLGYDVVRRDLQELGYSVKEGIYSAEEVGATHQRKRLFILAMANSEHTYLEKSYRSKSKRSKQASEEMADTYSDDTRRSARSLSEQSCKIERKTQGENREWCRNEFRNSCENLADTDSERRQLQVERQFTTEQFIGWPAPQGSYQHEWEESRTIKPGVGCTIDGYNFRTDLLRMYGNGVVHQVSALAFADLLNKHFKSL